MPTITIDPITVTTTVSQPVTANAVEIVQLTVNNSGYANDGNVTAQLSAMPFNNIANPDGTPVYASSDQIIRLNTSNYLAAAVNVPALATAFVAVEAATQAWFVYRNARLADLASVQATLISAQTALTSAQSAVTVARQNLTVANSSVNTEQAVVTVAQAAVTTNPTDATAQANLTSAKQALQTAQNNVIAARTVLQQAQAAFGPARAAVASAQTLVTTAQAAVNDPANPPVTI